MRSLFFTALTLAIPPQLKHAAVKTISGPRVTTTIDSVVAVAPHRAYDHLIAEAAVTYRVDPKLIRSVMETESAFDTSAVSRAGALGLMQLMPDIADAFGVTNPFDPRQNIMAGARLLRELLDQYRGNLSLVLAGYNAGAKAVSDYGAVPPFPETINYVKRVKGRLAEARGEGDE